MSEKPIIFSGPMVRAILDDRKWQTRRVINPQPEVHEGVVFNWPGNKFPTLTITPSDLARHGPYQVGQHLWVRETWASAGSDDGPCICYRSDYDRHYCSDDAFPVEYERYPGADFSNWAGALEAGIEGRWTPSIFMPRWASRITLEITGIRVERIQDISEAGAIAEGWYGERGDGITAGYLSRSEADTVNKSMPRRWFANLWNSLNANRPGCSWADNPWCWVLEFRRVEP